MSDEPEPGLAPESTLPRYDDQVRLTVDGEEFLVRHRADEPGTYDFDWLSGPHEYGFGSSSSDRSRLSRPEMTEAIRSFLAEIDPATGYLAD
ncbi:hypothetical protein O7606_18965 [Micromonospora sp. WMMD882]|uniref:hypothetical protein n=1 Tax=Micromonospora sp. WMMD882 TaxID=3015151 RepID=UPI00248C58A2|nr:hypothetical protein [Micromonospora sp. WMMD882]WBB78299.1 hypothetical protein O7606_18965 [Micromonospora sp. WMMD882]